MAKKGEIDPWNIDVVELADKFLKRVEDLRVSARVLLYAAILVRMKAEVIVSEAVVEDEPEISDVDYVDAEFDFHIDEPVVERPRRPKRYTTLQELIRELRKADMLITRRKRRRIRAELPKAEVLEAPHEEDIEEIVTRVYEELLMEFRSRKEVSFFEFTEGFDRRRLVSYYVSILHLAYRGKIELIQEKFYEDIKIKPLS